MSQCWSYNADFERCELDAGDHDIHQVITTWTDQDSWQPLGAAPRQNLKQVNVPVVNLPMRDEHPQTCSICTHDWHEDECMVMRPEGITCGCITPL